MSLNNITKSTLLAARSARMASTATKFELPLLRSLLFVPGNKLELLNKSLRFAPDAFVFDLEDSVPRTEKDNGREVLRSFLKAYAKQRADEGTLSVQPLVIPRVNSLDTPHVVRDLLAVIEPTLTYGICIGKINSAEEVRQLGDEIATVERSLGLPPNRIKMLPTIESARAIVNAYEISAACPERMIGTTFGADDYAFDMAIQRSVEGQELTYARAAMAVAARAANVLCIDTPYPHFKNTDGLLKESDLVKSLGFTGKFAIHPAQVEHLNVAFAPSEAEIDFSRRAVQAYEEAQHGSGRGSTSVDGRMVDMPVYRRARQVLETAAKMPAKPNVKA